MRSLIVFIALLLLLAAGATATACDQCQRFGITALHERAFAGDAYDDAHTGIPQYEDKGYAEFNTTGNKWPQPGPCGTNCLGQPVTITYSYQNMFDGALLMPNGQPLPANIIRSSIEEALGLWASVAPLNFVEVEDDGLSYSQGSTKYGQIRFRHILINGPDPAVGDPIAKAQAYFPTGGTYAGDVEFDHGDRWQVSGTLSQPDILGAAIHEIGHSLGLAHSTVQDPNEVWTWWRNVSGQVVEYQTPKGAANMFWIFNRYPGPGSGFLFQDDIDGIRSVYGTGVGSVSPLNAIPEPTNLALGFVAVLLASSRRRR